MAKIQELLEGRDDRIDYEQVVAEWPWIIQRDLPCVMSPDSDGFLCGLFMSSVLGWEVKGFYDGKVMLLQKGVDPTSCVFVDMEVFRRDIRSVGHHMLLYNVNELPETWDNFASCIQPNNMREYDKLHTFRLKYPLATVHLLVGIIGSKQEIRLPESAICPLLFTDGVFKNLFSHPENVLNWLRYLRVDEEQSPLNTIFANETYSVPALMRAMDDFFRRRDEITIKRERGDRLKLSDKNGAPYNIQTSGDAYSIDDGAVERIERFVQILSELTEWEYNKESWVWKDMKLYKFTKRSFSQDELNLNGPNFQRMIRRNPLSWAATSNTNIEYTLEEPDRLSEG